MLKHKINCWKSWNKLQVQVTLSSIRRGSPFWPQARHCWLAKTTWKQFVKTKFTMDVKKITLHMKTKFAPNVKTKSVLCSLEIVSWEWQSTRLHLHCWGKLLENILNLFSDLLSDRCEYTSTIRLTFWDIQCYGMIFGSPPHWWTCKESPSSVPQWCLPKLLEKRTHIWKTRHQTRTITVTIIFSITLTLWQGSLHEDYKAWPPSGLLVHHPLARWPAFPEFDIKNYTNISVPCSLGTTPTLGLRALFVSPPTIWS